MLISARRVYQELRAIRCEMQAIRSNQENCIMPTLADVMAADAQVKTELDTIRDDVAGLVTSMADLKTQLAAAIAASDPALLQAALDQATANVAEGQAIVDSMPKPAP